MECPTCSDNLTAYLDAELSDPDREQVEKHLNFCHACTLEFQSLSVAYGWVDRSLDTIGLRPEIWTRIEASLPARAAPAAHGGWQRFLAGLGHFPGRGWAASFAAVAILAAVVFLRPMAPAQSDLDLEGLRKELSVMVQEKDRQDTLRHNSPSDAGNDKYGSNPYAPEQVSLEFNPFHLSEPGATAPAVNVGSGATAVGFNSEGPETRESR